MEGNRFLVKYVALFFMWSMMNSFVTADIAYTALDFNVTLADAFIAS